MSIVFLYIVNLVCLVVVLCMVCIATVYATTSVCLSASHDKDSTLPATRSYWMEKIKNLAKRTSPVSTHILHRG